MKPDTRSNSGRSNSSQASKADKRSGWLRKLDEECPHQVVLPRKQLADEQRVPAYVVFSDRTLVELATHRPGSEAAMREIHGIGDTKLARYGTAFLDVVRDHKS